MSKPLRETMKQAGYRYIRSMGYGQHLLQEIDSNRHELWACNKNHASYGIIFKNTHLEFLRGYDIPKVK